MAFFDVTIMQVIRMILYLLWFKNDGTLTFIFQLQGFIKKNRIIKLKNNWNMKLIIFVNFILSVVHSKNPPVSELWIFQRKFFKLFQDHISRRLFTKRSHTYAAKANRKILPCESPHHRIKKKFKIQWNIFSDIRRHVCIDITAHWIRWSYWR